ncbi:MAG: 50S ribosomal protein L29 [Candidatus Anoxychlamydiales bacterium]|nr:50S ribosomal protein L29 [Candidatus Anoxychlamydiales bacterium]
MTKLKELKELSIEQLEFRIDEINKTLFEIRNELAINHKVEKPHLLKTLKKEKAQIKTIMHLMAKK